jgi:ribosomal-protein-alanine N-acetyltransferase
MIIGASATHLEDILVIEWDSFKKPWTEYHFKSDLNNIAVEKSFRGNGIGIGIHLLRNMELHMKDIKVKSVYLEVSSSNLPARKLYEKMGFVPQGECKDYYAKGDDAVLYTLEF